MTALRALGADIDADLGAIIAGGAARLHVDLDPGQVDQLVAYLRLIDRWNATYNLTAVRDVRAMATQHIVDSLSVVPFLVRLGLGRTPFRVLDVGSGAGLPGVVISIALPKTTVVCIDSVGKKTAFITQVATALALRNLESIKARVESVDPPPVYDVIVSRAFASLSDFVTATRHLLRSDGHWLAMKGKVPVEELAEVRRAYTQFEVHVLEVPGLDADRCLLMGKASADLPSESRSS